MHRLGVVCGLVRERRCLERAWVGERPRIRVAPGPAAAAKAAHALAAEGADVVLSFGMAGGLEPNLGPGTLVVPEAVGDGEATIALDGEGLRAALGARGGHLLSVASPLEQPAAKAAAAARGFVAVDMESFAVVSAARSEGRRGLVLRAVADPAIRVLPHVTKVAIGGDGHLRPLRAIGAILTRPQEWRLVGALARDARAAEASLGRATSTLARLAGEGRL